MHEIHESVSLLQGANLSVDAFVRQPAPWTSSVLGALGFCADMAGEQIAATDVPCLQMAIPRLHNHGDSSVCEVWRSCHTLTQGRHGAIHYRHDDEIVFGVIALPETQFAPAADRTPLQQAAESAYGQVFALLDDLRFPHVLRFWNYFASINTESYGLERYRQFNLGRQTAFVASGRHEQAIFPAACALGGGAGPLNVAFMASRVAPRNIENPRQISAYHYPQQYGPRSPMFSRASLVRLQHEWVLFISGTASIVGHTTLHEADVLAQTRETMANIKAVLAEANRFAPQPGFAPADLHYKVYVRNPADMAAIRDELHASVGDALKAVYLRADVCRRALLLEIEACAALPSAPGGSGGA